jgi:hypothetical protein
MAATLHEMLLSPGVQPQVVADCQAMIDQEVASKSGLSATGIKVAYKAVTGFGDYLAKRPTEVAEALLSVTDAKGRTSGRPTVVRAYNAVRGGAGKHIEAALPNLGAMIQKYA